MKRTSAGYQNDVMTLSDRGAPLRPSTFNRLIRQAPVSPGYMQERIIPISACLFSGMTPANVGGAVVAVADNSADACLINFVTPGNYDQRSDRLELRVLASAASGSNNTIEIDDFIYWRAGSSTAGDPNLPASASTPQPVSSQGPSQHVFVLSNADRGYGLGLRPGDSCTITLGFTRASANITLHGLALRFSGGPVMKEVSER